jgi:hypothetical protein
MRTVLVSVLGGVVWLVAQPVVAQEMAKPGPEHKMLHRFVGDWDVTVNVGGNASKAAATYKMEPGGFWLFETFRGDFGGMKFTGHGTTGYDPLRKSYVATWVDSMSPSLLVMDGHMSKDGKTFTATGSGPGMDGKLTKMKTVYQFKGKNSFSFTLYTVADGKDTEMMAMTYHRKK